MKTIFYVKIPQIFKTGKYTVEIPGFPAEVAPKNPEFASTKVAAIQRATELLEGIFLNCISKSEPIPSQIVNNTAGLEPIAIDEYLAFVLWLCLERAKKNYPKVKLRNFFQFLLEIINDWSFLNSATRQCEQ